MRDLKAKVAYLQGLSNGLNLDPNTREGKLLGSIIEVLDEFAETLHELEDAQEKLEDYLQTIDDDLYELEDAVYNGREDEEEEFVEVECPRCGEIVCFESSILEDDDVIEVTCPNCDEVVFVNDDFYESADEPVNLENRAAVQEDDL